MAERIYLTVEDVLWIHDEQLRLYGGASGVRDEGLILSALLRPQTGYYSDVIEEAAALWESLAMNHGFVDGNKRVAFASTILFLEANGVLPIGTEEEWIAFIYSNLEAGTFRKPVIEDWLGKHTSRSGNSFSKYLSPIPQSSPSPSWGGIKGGDDGAPGPSVGLPPP